MKTALSVLIMCAVNLSSAFAQSLNETIESVMAEFMQLDQFSGTVLLAKEGDILFAKAYGEADKDFHVKNTLQTKYNIGSAGKTFTGIAIMQLAEAGKLSVDDPVIDILSDFPFGNKIKIKHLLTHTSGIYNYFAHPDFQQKKYTIRSVSDALPLIYDQNLRFETPGEKFFYSNSGIVILGAVIEKITGQKYQDYIKENILIPVGMQESGIHFLEDIVENRAVGYTKTIRGNYKKNIFSVPPANADGGMETTVLDLLKYDQALYDTVLLNKESRIKLFTPFKKDYAFCWGVEHIYNNTVVGHSGGAPGVSAIFRRYLTDHYTLIVLSNYSNSAFPVANTIEAIIFKADYTKPRKPLDEYLYAVIKTKGIEEVLENFTRLLREGGYEITSSNTLNRVGYAFLEDHLPGPAIKIFEKNTQLFPNEANPYDSLGEAFMIKGDLQKSRAAYKKALEIDPQFENAEKMIEKLENMRR